MGETINYDFDKLRSCIIELNTLKTQIKKPTFKDDSRVKQSSVGNVKGYIVDFSQLTDKYYQQLESLINKTYDFLTSSETLKQIDESIADTFMDDLYTQGKPTIEPSASRYKDINA